MSSNKLFFTLGALALTACGGEALDSETAEAALVAHDAVAGVATLVDLHGDTQASLPMQRGFAGMDLDAVATAAQQRLQNRPRRRAGCVSVTRIGVCQREIVFDTCELGRRDILVDGMVLSTLSLDPSQGRVGHSSSFFGLVVGDRTLTGSMASMFHENRPSSSFSVNYQLSVARSGQATRDVAVTATATADGGARSLTLRGVGSVDDGQDVSTLTLNDVVLVAGDGAPSGGSVTVQRGRRTVEVVFNQQTPATGRFEVYLNGRSLGDFDLEELLELLDLIFRP